MGGCCTGCEVLEDLSAYLSFDGEGSEGEWCWVWFVVDFLSQLSFHCWLLQYRIVWVDSIIEVE